MFILTLILLTTLFYSVFERNTRDCSFKRVGGLTFVRIGRLSFSYSLRKAS